MGHKRKTSGTPEYLAWLNAKSRCNNPNNKMFRYYGGRGIEFKFNTFAEFLSCVGKKPLGTSLDRINNDGNYEPGNVRWATKAQQMLNRSDNKRITHDGKTHTLKEWSEIARIPMTTLWARLNGSHWSFERAISTPVMSLKEASKLGIQARWG